jgi:hypothetical protein
MRSRRDGRLGPVPGALLIGVHGVVFVNAARRVLPVFDGWKGRSWLLG